MTMPAPALATWSIVAVDPQTREVGSAGASCTPFVVGIAALVPGRGAVVAQAMSNMAAKEKAVELLQAGEAATAIVNLISNRDFDPSAEHQQYGVASLHSVRGKSMAAAFTGSETAHARGHLLGDGLAVQGNILASDHVLTATFEAFTQAARAGKPLAEALLLALEAGSTAGGDTRCGLKTAQSAYLGVARPEDPMGRPSLRLVSTTDEDELINPVALLRARFEAQKSTPQ